MDVIVKLKKYGFSLEEIFNSTLQQLNLYLEAALKQENHEYKLGVSASLVGSRGDQETVNSILKKG